MMLVYRLKSHLTDLFYHKDSKKFCDVVLSQKSYMLYRD